jgi:hypothetical protein
LCGLYVIRLLESLKTYSNWYIFSGYPTEIGILELIRWNDILGLSREEKVKALDNPLFSTK